MTRVYVAGAYSAPNVMDVFANMDRGMDLCVQVLRAGFAPFCPWNDHHFLLRGCRFTVEEMYAYSMAWLEVSDCVLVQPIGAKQSVGTQAEIKRARELGIPVFYGLESLKEWANEQG